MLISSTDIRTDVHAPSTDPHEWSTTARLAGTSFVAAWLVGLAVHPAGVTSADSAAEVAAHYVSHRAAALGQAVLVHGVAAAAVALFAVAVGRLAAARGHGTAGRRLAAAGIAAAVLSAVQAVLDVAMILGAGSATPSTTHTLLAAVERLDAAKLVALGVVAWCGLALARGGLLPRWTGRIAVALLACLVVAAAGLGAGVSALAVAAVPGLVLLLAWVGGVAWTARRRVV